MSLSVIIPLFGALKIIPNSEKLHNQHTYLRELPTSKTFPCYVMLTNFLVPVITSLHMRALTARAPSTDIGKNEIIEYLLHITLKHSVDP